MGYLLLILFFLIWRNIVQIKRAVNYSVYGTTANPRNIFRKFFIKLADIRNDEVQRKEKLNKVDLE